jgi:hypothetical protein
MIGSQGYGKKLPWPDLRYCPFISLEGTEENHYKSG